MGSEKPLCIDLFAGLGGWSEGFLAEGYRCIGFDIERHDYGSGGYPGQLVLQDVLTLHGSQFRDAAVIVASPPCQAYSRYAMPFGSLWREHCQMDDDGAPPGNYPVKGNIFNHLFRACFRIQSEAIQSSGRFIPLIVENVKGAQRWLGPAKWHFGSFYLYGDVPALMPMLTSTKNKGGSWFAIGSPGQKQVNKNPDGRKGSVGIADGAAPKGTGNSSWFFGKRADPRDVRMNGGNPILADGTKIGGGWWHDSTNNLIRKCSSRSVARKAASAQIAKIPLALSTHIARVYKP